MGQGSVRWLEWLRSLGAVGLGLPRGVWFLVAVAWSLLIWGLSNRQGSSEPGHFVFSWIGNLAHAPLFGLLALWLALAGPRVAAGFAPGKSWVRLQGASRTITFLTVLSWGVIDELHQSQTPGRDASVLDLVTDGVGAWAVLWVAGAVGCAAATEQLVRRRLWRGVLACLAAALAATLGPI